MEMILCYNETKIPWEIQSTMNNFVKLFRTYSTEIKNSIRVRQCSIFMNERDSKSIEQLKSIADDTCNHTTIKNIFDKPTVLKFGHKDLKPFIIRPNSDINRNILLITLDIAKRQVASVYMGKNIILDHINNGRELTLILSVTNALKDSAYVNLYDGIKKEIHSYNLNYVDGEWLMVKSIKKINNFKDRPLNISNFKPKTTTQVVISQSYISDKMKKVLINAGKDINNYHKLFDFDQPQQLVNLIRKLKYQNYRALTLFIDYNTMVGIDTDTLDIISRLENNFDIVFILLNDGVSIQYKL